MAPFVHKLSFPKYLAEHFSRGSKEKYNDYAFAYCRNNNHDMQIVTTIKGKPEDPQSRGFVLGIYKPGFSPKEMQERRAEKKKKGGKSKWSNGNGLLSVTH
jgi:hypothetical protein